jgi:hypothetical protein
LKVGEAKRRRRPATVKVSVEELHVEAAGVLRFEAFKPSDVVGLWLKAAGGDARALQYLQLLDNYWRQADARRASGDAILCCACDRKLTPSTCDLLGVVTAERDDARNAMVLGFCTTCYAGPADNSRVEPAVLALYRDVRFPETFRA